MSISTQARNATPIWLRIVAVVGIIWYAFGLLQFWLGYSMDINAAVSAGQITSAHGEAIAATPILVWLAFALASLCGLIGSFFLFSKNVKATSAFAISLISALIYYAWVYGISGTASARPTEEIYIAITVLLVTFIFLILSRKLSY